MPIRLQINQQVTGMPSSEVKDTVPTINGLSCPLDHFILSMNAIFPSNWQNGMLGPVRTILSH